MNILDYILLGLVVLSSAIALSNYLRLQKFKNQLNANEEAQQQQFYEIVHEFRAPLTAVKDAATLLNDMPGSLPPDKREQMLHLIKNECIRILGLVSDFLDASKIRSNKITLEKTPNDFKKLIEEKVLMFTPQAKAASIELVSSIDPMISQVMYDRKYMDQVMNNLISNSLKYTPAGGKITVEATLVDNTISVSVFDNGVGVASEKQKELFTKFASINDRNSMVASSGLGLYVAKGIIEAHGGKVSVETQQNRGYKLTFTLPISATAAFSNVAAPAVTAPPAPPIAK